MITHPSRLKRLVQPDLSPADLAVTWQSVSLLLDYPDDGAPERFALVREAIDRKSVV